MSRTRIGSIEANTPCSRCGLPIPLEGPDQEATCPHCQSVDEISWRTWSDILFRVDEALARMQGGQRQSETAGGVRGGRTVRYTIQQGAPRCHACNASLEDDAEGRGKEGPVSCAACGAESFGMPVDNHMRGRSNARRLWRRSRPGAGAGQGLSVDQEAARAVVFQCPKCAGGLEATSKSERIMRCRYCDAEVFIPDELWRRLHPVRTAEPFWVRFEGPTHAVRTQENLAREEKQRQERERQAHEERLRQAEADRAARAERARGQMSAAWLGAIVFVLLSGSVTAMAWLEGGLLPGAPEGLLSIAREMTPGTYIAWIVVAVIALIVGLALTSRPLQTASGHAGEWVFFKTWFWSIMVLAPGASLMTLVMAILVARGRFGSSRITTNGSHAHYDAVTLENGEGRPAGVLMAWHALVWPVLILGFVL